MTKVFILVLLCITTTMVRSEGYAKDPEHGTSSSDSLTSSSIRSSYTSSSSLPVHTGSSSFGKRGELFLGPSSSDSLTSSSSRSSYTSSSSLPVQTGTSSFGKRESVLVNLLTNKREGPKADGSYSFQFSSSDGISRQERGYPQGEDGAIVQEGSYQFPLPDGSIATFKYIADANGFRVESPFLPTPPPMPPHALAQIQRAKIEREQMLSSATKNIYTNKKKLSLKNHYSSYGLL